MLLRDYQNSAVESAINALKHNPYPVCLEAPTGSGKSVIIGGLIKKLLAENPSLRFIITAHVKELVMQNAEKMQKIMPDLDIGIYCAGLDRKDTGKKVTFATIQSAWNAVKDETFNSPFGKVHVIIVDEAHRINTEDEGIYRKFIRKYQDFYSSKVIGFTATPYRTHGGPIVSKDGLFKSMCYTIEISTLIQQKYISKPYTFSAKNNFNFDNVSLKNGDFDAKEAGNIMSDLDEELMKDLVERTKDKKHILCFCCNIDHAEKTSKIFKDYGIESEVIHSKTKGLRDSVISKFQGKKTRCLINVNILTEGFDSPFIDCIILMRATMSPGLYVQMIGRGFRITDDKKEFQVLDYGKNIERHGCIDDINTSPKSKKRKKRGEALVKICPSCGLATAIATRECEHCNYKFEIKKQELETYASSANILKKNDPIDVEVQKATYSIHQKEGMPDSLRVTYHTGKWGIIEYSEYICLFHDGFAKAKAKQWWMQRAEFITSFPEDIYEARIEARKFETPLQITVQKNGKYWNIIDYQFLDDLIDDIEGDVPF